MEVAGSRRERADPVQPPVVDAALTAVFDLRQRSVQEQGWTVSWEDRRDRRACDRYGPGGMVVGRADPDGVASNWRRWVGACRSGPATRRRSSRGPSAG